MFKILKQTNKNNLWLFLERGGTAKGDNSGGGTGGSAALAKRVLVLAQKGDWSSCENSVKALDKMAAEEGSKPLAGVADNVRLF